MQNHAESYGNYVKKSVLDPNRAKFDENSEFGYVRTCQGQSRRTSPCQQSRLLLISHESNPSLSINKLMILGKVVNLLIKIGRVEFQREKKGKPALLTRTCPPGLALASPDMTEVRVLVKFRTCRIQNWLFEVISNDSAWFCVEELKKHSFSIKNTIFNYKTNLDPKIL